MKKTHSSKKQAWYLSLISLVLCVAMLAGTTFAWFTDNVTSGINTIAAGVLDVELYHTNAAVADEKVEETTKLFLDKNGDAILWEPGVVSWENLRITNAGDLALNWKLSINTANENFVIDPETGTYNGLSKALKVGIVPGGVTATERADVVASVAAADWTTLSSFITDGQLLPASEGTYEETFGIVIWWEPGENDNLWNLNNDKQLTSGDVLSIDLGIKLVASQMVYENDSFNNDYDEEATYAFSGSYSHNISVATDADGKVAVEATMGNADEVASALVPVGTKLEAGTTDMTLSVNSMEGSGANITAGAGESISSVDVHVTGLAADNTVPVKVTVKHLLPKYMNAGNYTLYHVENGAPVLMTLVTDPVAHNEYSYDPFTGDVTMTLANFCEISAAIKNIREWEGKTAEQFSGGTGTADDPFLIASADQLALMSKMVSGNVDAKAAFNYSTAVPETTDFANSSYKLVADIYFPGEKKIEPTEDDSLIFYPVGYWYSNEVDGKGMPIYQYNVTFTGSFDGQGHTISGIYQNTWQMNGYYNDGYPAGSYHWKAAMGLFGAVFDAEIKNLTISNFTSDGEFTPTGVVAAFAGGNSVFENITLEECNPRVYNTGNGGIVGLNYNDTEGSVDNLTFRNITVDQTNKITALWGSYDVSCGGILGRLRDNDKHGANQYNTATFENCHVAAIIDVYNDVCANYQYYQYRYSGMYIGTVDYVDTIGVQEVKNKIVKAENCFVYVGDWNQYWYCELVANSLASYTHDHQFSRLEIIQSEEDIKNTDGSWKRSGNFVIPATAEEKAICYHIIQTDDGLKQHKHEDAGFETFDLDGNGYLDDLKEDRQHYYLPFNQLFTGYGWGSTAVRELEGIKVDDNYTGSVKKFEANSNTQMVLNAGETYTLGSLFTEMPNVHIHNESVQALLSSPNNALILHYSPDTSNWKNGTITVEGSGVGTLRISDYSYCKATAVEIAVNSNTHSAHCVCANTTAGSHEIIQGWTEWDGKSDITAGGNYYLTQDITGSTQYWIGLRHDETGANENIVINLCLNGHKIASNNRIFGIGKGATVNLMNCQGTESVLTGYGTTDDAQHATMVEAGLIFVQADARLNIYDRITLELLEKKDKEGNALYPKSGGIIATSSGAVVTMYGGTMKNGRATENGGAVHVSMGSSFYMKGGEIIDSQALGQGGSVFVSENSVFEMTGGTISGGQAQQHGGNVFVYTSGAATISGGTITGGQAPHGGNIYADTNAKQLTVNGGEITGGVANGNGGNIYLYYSKNNEISGGTISGGQALNGGNIFTTNVTLLVSGNAMITGGIASNATDVSHGGNIDLGGSSVLQMTGGTITGGKVDGVDDKNELGGNVYVSQTAKVDISGGTISNGFAADLGGNIYFAYLSKDNKIGGDAYLVGGDARNGGSIYADNKSSLAISGGTISGGKADTHGGNLCIGQDALLTLTGGIIENGTAASGGNIFVSSAENTHATVNMSGATIKNGTANGTNNNDGGGNIFVAQNSTFNLTGGTISGGKSTAKSGGGNILIYGNGAKLAMSGGIVENGTATDGHGGNMYAYDAGSVEITGGIVRNGKVLKVSNTDRHGGNIALSGNDTQVIIKGSAQILGGTSANRAGNIFFHSGKLTIEGNAKITGGSADNGGNCIRYNSTVVSTTNNGELILSGSPEITDIYVDETDKPITVENLTAGEKAIGITCVAGVTAFANTDKSGYAKCFTSTNKTYYVLEENNTLRLAGHATHCVCGNTNADDGCSHANIQGEWIAWDGSTDITVSGNYYLTKDITSGYGQKWLAGYSDHATALSVNLCLNGHSITSINRVFGIGKLGTVNLMNCGNSTAVLKGRCADGDHGGVILNFGTTSNLSIYPNIKVETIEASRKVTQGGAIRTAGTLNLYGCEIEGTAVSGTGGGAIYVDSNGKLNIYGAKITGAAAEAGGAIYNKGIATIYSGEIVGSPSTKGSAIYNSGTLTIEDGIIRGAAATYGGAIYNDGKITMNNGEIIGADVGRTVAEGGYLRGEGGAIYMGANSSFTLNNGIIRGGNGKHLSDAGGSRSLGGVAYLAAGSKFDMKNGTLYGSKTGDGGVFYATNATITISDGMIYAGYAGYGGGAAKLSKSTFTMSGGTIDGANDLGETHNAGAAGGGALFVESGSNVTINGNAVIKNCVTTANGGAIEVYQADATITLGGNVQITENYKLTNGNRVANNIYVDFASSNNTPAADLKLESSLTANAKIGITLSTVKMNANNGRFVTGATEAQAGAFVSDSTSYTVVYENNNLYLRAATNG